MSDPATFAYITAAIAEADAGQPPGQVTYTTRITTNARIEPGSNGAVVAVNAQVNILGDGETGEGGHFVGHKSVARLIDTGTADQAYAAEAAIELAAPGRIAYAANWYSYLQGSVEGAQIGTFANFCIAAPGNHEGHIDTWVGLDNPVLFHPGNGTIGETIFIRNLDPAQRIETAGPILLAGDAAIQAETSLRMHTQGEGGVILGDASNQAPGNMAAALGGKENVVRGLTATAVGYRNTVNAFGGFAAGIANAIEYHAVGGAVFGQSNAVHGRWSIASGYYATDRGRTGLSIHASGPHHPSRQGLPQTIQGATLRGISHGAGLAVLTTDGEAPGLHNVLNLAPHSTQVMKALISAQAAGRGAAAWEASWVIRKDDAVASTSLVGMPQAILLAADPSLHGARVSITVDSSDATAGAIRIACTGVADLTIHWAATVHGLENGAPLAV